MRRLDSSFNNRDNAEYLDELGALVCNACKVGTDTHLTLACVLAICLACFASFTSAAARRCSRLYPTAYSHSSDLTLRSSERWVLPRCYEQAAVVLCVRNAVI